MNKKEIAGKEDEIEVSICGSKQAPKDPVDLHMLAGNSKDIVGRVRGSHLDLRAFSIILTQQRLFSFDRDYGAIAVAKIRSRLNYRDVAFADILASHRIVTHSIRSH